MLTAFVSAYAASAAVKNVSVEDNNFAPALLAVQTGDTVVWTQNGGDHDVVGDEGLFTSGDIIPYHATFSFTFLEPGDYGYYCSIHGSPGSGMAGTVSVTMRTGGNTVPATPANQQPAAGATNLPTAVTLMAAAFSDPDSGDTYAASQWLVRRGSDGQIIFDSGEDTANKTELTLPVGTIQYGAAYSWQVRYKDSAGNYSDYSAPTTFATTEPTLRGQFLSGGYVLSWPTNSAGFSLESTTMPISGWAPVNDPATVSAQSYFLTNSLSEGMRFFRLKKQ